MNIDITYLQETESTNKLLKQKAMEGAEVGKTIVAWKQTEGRGRLGRNFASPEGGIYMSILLPLENVEGNITITAKAAVAVRRAIEEATDKNTGIKWVNDIIYKGKKVCGILAESVGDKVVLGIGVNFSTRQQDFPEDIRDIAISLYKCPQEADSDPCDLVNAILKQIVRITGEDKKQWLDEYRYASVISGQEVDIFQAGKKVGNGIVKCIDDDCALHVVDKTKGEMILSTGEVSIKKVK